MDEQIGRFADSGWIRCESIRDGLERAKLPVPTARYLERAFSSEEWKRAGEAVAALRARFEEARFGRESTFGVLLVPDSTKLDTRGAIDPSMRRDQSEERLVDHVDPRMPKGKLITRTGKDWTLVATITGPAGIFLGSHDEIAGGEAAGYTVQGVDTRGSMVRQVWGARVLQAGTDLPDSTVQKTWTFTLFPGEGPTDGCAASGTILHGKVRFRLGRTDRRISSARVCPAIVVG